MKTVLVIVFLSVKSSYARNTCCAATGEVFDTVQFYAAGGVSWRIRTYAIDEDVHIWCLGPAVLDIVALARTNTEKHYGDLLTEGYIIETEAGLEGVRKELLTRGLSTHLELTKSGAVFWAAEGSHYRTKSAPKRRGPT